MARIESIRISKTMAYLLRHKPEHGKLTLDDGGWVDLQELTVAVSTLLKAEIEIERVRLVVESDGRRFEIIEHRIRAMVHPRRGGRGGGTAAVPLGTSPNVVGQADHAGEAKGTSQKCIGPDAPKPTYRSLADGRCCQR